jgi:hypothetical protein
MVSSRLFLAGKKLFSRSPRQVQNPPGARPFRTASIYGGEVTLGLRRAISGATNHVGQFQPIDGVCAMSADLSETEHVAASHQLMLRVIQARLAVVRRFGRLKAFNTIHRPIGRGRPQPLLKS